MIPTTPSVRAMARSCSSSTLRHSGWTAEMPVWLTITGRVDDHPEAVHLGHDPAAEVGQGGEGACAHPARRRSDRVRREVRQPEIADAGAIEVAQLLEPALQVVAAFDAGEDRDRALPL